MELLRIICKRNEEGTRNNNIDYTLITSISKTLISQFKILISNRFSDMEQNGRVSLCSPYKYYMEKLLNIV